MHAAGVFKDLDEIVFVAAFVSACVFVYFCTLVEYRRWLRNKIRDEKLEVQERV